MADAARIAAPVPSPVLRRARCTAARPGAAAHSGAAARAPRAAPLPAPRQQLAPLPRSARRGAAAPPLRASLADQLLDVIEGGPKLRRWYGAEKKPPRDSGGPVRGQPARCSVRLLALSRSYRRCALCVFATQEPEPEPEVDEEDPADAVRDAVLVSEADSPVGEARSQRATRSHAHAAP
jgi:hypothetical protein